MNAAEAEGKAEHRRARRRQVLKRGQLVFGSAGSTIDCLILDESPFGVRLETPVMTHFPEHLQIRFAGGATYDAVRHWSAGNKAGLEFVGTRIDDEAMLRHRNAARRTLETQGVQAAAQMLRDLEFFQSDDLREAAEAAELAVARLRALLE